MESVNERAELDIRLARGSHECLHSNGRESIYRSAPSVGAQEGRAQDQRLALLRNKAKKSFSFNSTRRREVGQALIARAR